MPLTGIEYRRVASRGALLAFVRAHRERSAAQPATLARLPLSPTPPHLPKRNSSAASPTASLHCWHSAMRRSPSWAASSTQCCRSSALARSATSSSICPKISGVATRRDRHHHRFAQEFLALLTPSGPRPVRMKACCDCDVGAIGFNEQIFGANEQVPDGVLSD